MVVNSLLDAGIKRVVLGTAAVQDEDFVKQALREHPHNIAIGIDALDGNVQVSGWTENSNIRATALAKRLQLTSFAHAAHNHCGADTSTGRKKQKRFVNL